MLVGLVPPPLGIRGRLKLTTDFPLSLQSHPRDVLHREGTHKNRRPDKGQHEGGEHTANFCRRTRIRQNLSFVISPLSRIIDALRLEFSRCSVLKCSTMPGGCWLALNPCRRSTKVSVTSHQSERVRSCNRTQISRPSKIAT